MNLNEINQSLIDLMNWRFACKNFDTSKKIEKEKLEKILEATRLTPSAFGLQSWKFIVVTNSELLEKLLPACYNQPQVKSSVAMIFLCADTNINGENGSAEIYISALSKTLDQPKENFDGLKNALIKMEENQTSEKKLAWLQNQIYLAAGTLMIAAAEQKIDASPMEGFSANQVAEILELPENIVPTLSIALGYRAEEAPKKVRVDLERIVDWRE